MDAAHKHHVAPLKECLPPWQIKRGPLVQLRCSVSLEGSSGDAGGKVLVAHLPAESWMGSDSKSRGLEMGGVWDGVFVLMTTTAQMNALK